MCYQLSCLLLVCEVLLGCSVYRLGCSGRSCLWLHQCFWFVFHLSPTLSKQVTHFICHCLISYWQSYWLALSLTVLYHWQCELVQRLHSASIIMWTDTSICHDDLCVCCSAVCTSYLTSRFDKKLLIKYRNTGLFYTSRWSFLVDHLDCRRDAITQNIFREIKDLKTSILLVTIVCLWPVPYQLELE